MEPQPLPNRIALAARRANAFIPQTETSQLIAVGNAVINEILEYGYSWDAYALSYPSRAQIKKSAALMRYWHDRSNIQTTSEPDALDDSSQAHDIPLKLRAIPGLTKGYVLRATAEVAVAALPDDIPPLSAHEPCHPVAQSPVYQRAYLRAINALFAPEQPGRYRREAAAAIHIWRVAAAALHADNPAARAIHTHVHKSLAFLHSSAALLKNTGALTAEAVTIVEQLEDVENDMYGLLYDNLHSSWPAIETAAGRALPRETIERFLAWVAHPIQIGRHVEAALERSNAVGITSNPY